jgi:hypothetical protein
MFAESHSIHNASWIAGSVFDLTRFFPVAFSDVSTGNQQLSDRNSSESYNRFLTDAALPVKINKNH